MAATKKQKRPDPVTRRRGKYRPRLSAQDAPQSIEMLAASLAEDSPVESAAGRRALAELAAASILAARDLDARRATAGLNGEEARALGTLVANARRTIEALKIDRARDEDDIDLLADTPRDDEDDET